MAWKRWIAAFDIHGNIQNEKVVSKFFDFCDKWNPSLRYLGGDLYNFGPLRRKATEDEKCEGMEQDYDDGTSFFTHFKPTAWVLGNHDQRLWDLEHNSHGDIRLLAGQLIKEIEGRAKEVKCEILPYDARRGVIRVGNWNLVHGFYVGAYAARRHAASYRNCFFGHVHGFSQATTEDIDGSTAIGVGCLCEIDQEYNRNQPAKLRHANGWIYGIVSDKGDVHSWQAREIDGKFMLPSDIVAL